MAWKPPDLKNRSPKVEILPDLRKRVTRVYDILNEVTKAETAAGIQPGVSAYALAWGTADVAFADCLLTKQNFSGQADENGNNPAAPTEKPPQLTRVYETISATGETKVGDDETMIDQDGLTEVTQNFLQFSKSVAGVTPSFLTPGTSTITAENSVTCVLKEEQRTDDGTLQRIARHYISSGRISTNTDTKFNGALLLLTETWVNDPQSPPGSYVLVSHKEDHPGGLRVDTYTWALGTGQISNQTEFRLSPDQGTTGVTVQTIKYISLPSVSSNPITTPGGYEEISVEMAEDDGYRMWTAIYAFGQGIISTVVDMRFDNNLQVTTITSINTAPSAPSPALGGTVVLTKTEVRNGTRFEDGTVIYDYTWAEAKGGSTGAQIGIETEYLQSIDTGTNGVTKTTIRQIVAPASSIQPTTFSGSVLIKKEYSDAEGYGIWTTTWAKGAGLVLDESTIMEAGALVVYHRIGLGSAPSAPSGTIGGTVTLFESTKRNEEGYQAYDYHWVEANGQSRITTRGESDGALLYEVITVTASASTPAYPGSGTAYLIDLEQSQEDGYMRNRATYKKPPVSAALRKQKKFTMPGQIEITSPDPGFLLVPPVEMDILATETVDYGITQITTAPFTVSAYAGLQYSYTPTGGQPAFKVVGADKYLSASTSASGGSATFNGISVSAYAYQISASTPSSPPSGATTIEVDNDIYLVDITGTIVYRRRVVTYSF